MMIDSKNHKKKSARLKKITSLNGDLSPIVNGYKVTNEEIFNSTEVIDVNKTWNVMNYSEYVDYRSSSEEKSLIGTYFKNSLHGFDWDLVSKIHHQRHSTFTNEENTELSTKEDNPKITEDRNPSGYIFKFYKKFGLYWNVFPKTDYCYLPSSPDYKKEISPGVPKIPNLSRNPISSYSSRGYNLRSRTEKGYLSSSDVTEDNSTILSSTKVKAGTINLSSDKTKFVNVEAQQNVINSFLSQTETNKTAWNVIKTTTNNLFTSVKRATVTSFSQTSKLVSSSTGPNHMRILLLLLLLFLIPLLYFFFGSLGQENKISETINEGSSSLRFIYWIFNFFISFCCLVKDSVLLIPSMCLQLSSAIFTLFNLVTSAQNETVIINSPINSHSQPPPIPIVPVTTKYSQQLTKEEQMRLQSEIIIKEELASRESLMNSKIDKLQNLLTKEEQIRWQTEVIQKIKEELVDRDNLMSARIDKLQEKLTEEEQIRLQSEIIQKIKEELVGRENLINTRIEKLQEQVTKEEQISLQSEIIKLKEQMQHLTEDFKKIGETVENGWKEHLGKLEEEIKLELTDIRKSMSNFDGKAVVGFVATPNDLVDRAVAKYHADRTGKPDYALQTSGGYIVRVRCTQMYTKTAPNFYLLGLPLPWDVYNGPETIIKPGVMPGECWAFEGSYAKITLHLATKVKVTAFSIEHSPKELAPYGEISSAPKQFSVWALSSEIDEDPVFLGRFTFLDNGESLQQFEAMDYNKTVILVELRIESNHGHPEYTCLYRFRVHGVPHPVKQTLNETVNQNHQFPNPH